MLNPSGITHIDLVVMIHQGSYQESCCVCGNAKSLLMTAEGKPVCDVCYSHSADLCTVTEAMQIVSFKRKVSSALFFSAASVVCLLSAFSLIPVMYSIFAGLLTLSLAAPAVIYSRSYSRIAEGYEFIMTMGPQEDVITTIKRVRNDWKNRRVAIAKDTVLLMDLEDDEE